MIEEQIDPYHGSICAIVTHIESDLLGQRQHLLFLEALERIAHSKITEKDMLDAQNGGGTQTDDL